MQLTCKTISLKNQYLIHTFYIVINEHGYDDNQINSIKYLNDKGIGVRQSFL